VGWSEDKVLGMMGKEKMEGGRRAGGEQSEANVVGKWVESVGGGGE